MSVIHPMSSKKLLAEPVGSLVVPDSFYTVMYL